MLKVVIIADDLTGANDTGAILAQDGFKVGTILKTSDMTKFDDFDVLCYSTNSRGVSQEEAYTRVQNAANLFENRENIFFSKRIDSTLRGNVGAEIDSAIETLGDDTYAIVVASFPDSGRVSIGDYLLVNGVPLEKTEVAKDPTAPVKSSRVTEVVKIQTKYNVGYVSLEKVLKGAEVVKEEVLEKAKDNRIIVIDANKVEDIQEIAKGCVATGLKFVAIDPGTFTACTAHELYKDELQVKDNKKVLCGIGSASNLTRQQIQYLSEKSNPLIVKTNNLDFINAESREKEIQRVINEVVENADKYDTVVVTTTTDDGDVLDFTEIGKENNLTKKQCANLVTDSIATIVYRITARLRDTIGGVYTSGGDVSEGFCNKMGNVGYNVKDEVIPLAIYSTVVGGDFDGMPVVTKGGLVGDKETLVKCVDYLKEKITNQN